MPQIQLLGGDMKTKRRHELQTNYVADKLGEYVEQVRPYSKIIVGVAIALAVGGIAYLIVANGQAKKAGASWNAYYEAFDERDADLLRDNNL